MSVGGLAAVVLGFFGERGGRAGVDSGGVGGVEVGGVARAVLVVALSAPKKVLNQRRNM